MFTNVLLIKKKKCFDEYPSYIYLFNSIQSYRWDINVYNYFTIHINILYILKKLTFTNRKLNTCIVNF